MHDVDAFMTFLAQLAFTLFLAGAIITGIFNLSRRILSGSLSLSLPSLPKRNGKLTTAFILLSLSLFIIPNPITIFILIYIANKMESA